jgi:CRP-like cAMP-binding protein
MISPELLRHYAFFGGLPAEHLKSLAMLAERIPASAGQTVFSAGEPAAGLYLLITGSVDLYDVITDRALPGGRREYFLDGIGPGEVFGISALVEPYTYSLTARAATDLDLVRLDGAGLRAQLNQHADLAQAVLWQTTKALAGRLRDTRVLLAAARA